MTSLYELVRAYERAWTAEREALADRLTSSSVNVVAFHHTCVSDRVVAGRALYAAANDPAEPMKWSLAAAVMLRCIEQRATHEVGCERGKHCTCEIGEALQAAKDLGLKVPEDVTP